MKGYKNIARLCLAILICLCACHNDESSLMRPNEAWYDFVTLSALDDKSSTFTLRKNGDSELITYTSKYTFPGDTVLSQGDRLIIMYLRDDNAPAYTSGAITLYGYRYLDNSPQIPIVIDSLSQVNSQPIEVQSITRSGNYINLQAQLSCFTAAKPKSFRLVYDASSANCDIAELMIEYVAASPGENHFTGYASWDISNFWNNKQCQGLTIKYCNNQGIQSKTFLKQQ